MASYSKELTQEQLETRFAYRRLMIIANKIKTLIKYLPGFRNSCRDSQYEENEVISKTRLYLKKFDYGKIWIPEINVGISNFIYLELKLRRASYFTCYNGEYKFEVTPNHGNTIKSIKEELDELEQEVCELIKVFRGYLESINKNDIMKEIIGGKVMSEDIKM